MCCKAKNTKIKRVFTWNSWQAGCGRKTRFGVSVPSTLAALGIVFAVTEPALATIDNAATASGRYGDQLVQTEAAILELPVEPAKAELAVTQSVSLDFSGGEDAENVDGGDTVVLTVTVTNTGNVALRDVRPADMAVSAEGAAGVGNFAAFAPESGEEIAPGASQAFTVVYTLGAEDVYRAAGKESGLAVKAAAVGTGPAGEVTAQADDVSVTVAANPRLTIAKNAEIAKADGNRGADLETGDVITYTYTVSNSGNVPIDGVTVAGEHEGVLLNSADSASAEDGPFDETEIVADPLGVSADGGANGVWDVLGAGGAVTFTYRHTVTQAEFEAQ